MSIRANAAEAPAGCQPQLVAPQTRFLRYVVQNRDRRQILSLWPSAGKSDSSPLMSAFRALRNRILGPSATVANPPATVAPDPIATIAMRSAMLAEPLFSQEKLRLLVDSRGVPTDARDVAEFFNERFRPAPGARLKPAEVYSDWCLWVQCYAYVSQKAFGLIVRDLGIRVDDRNSRPRYCDLDWVGNLTRRIQPVDSGPSVTSTVKPPKFNELSRSMAAIDLITY